MFIFSKNRLDKYLAFAIASNSLLALLQSTFLHVFKIPMEITTDFRILLTACLMLPAIIVSFLRRPTLFFYTYTVAFFVMIIHSIAFPDNAAYIYSDGFKFFLPTVLPSLLCLMTLSSIEELEKAMTYISWCSFMLVIIYAIAYLKGYVNFSGYDMSLSYSLLLPSVFLYSQRKVYTYFATLLIFVFIVALGSRGAAVFILIYVLLDTIFYNRKMLFPLFCFAVLLIAAIPLLTIILDAYGISSRTLSMLADDNITNLTSRDSLYEGSKILILKNPITGIGLWGDRPIFGIYCHNLFLEILLNFGAIIGGILIVLLISYVIITYFTSLKQNKIIILKYACALILPLMISDSYLTSNNLFMFLGVLFLIRKNNK